MDTPLTSVQHNAGCDLFLRGQGAGERIATAWVGQEWGIFRSGNSGIFPLPQRLQLGFTKKGTKENSISQSRE